jgi:hypothetical protein
VAERIQRKRTKGWRMPDNTVYVGRPSKWGNPFKVGGQLHLIGKRAGQRTNAADVVGLYRAHLLAQPAAIAIIRAELAGKNLACWCPLVNEKGKAYPCHADVMLKIAAGELP